MKHLKIENPSEQTEDNSTIHESVTTEYGGPAIHDMDFDTWVSKTLSNDPVINVKRNVLKINQNIRIKCLDSISDGENRMAISVAFQNSPVANALTSSLLTSLTDVFNKIASNQSVSGVCLTSGLPSYPDINFCGGAHLRELSSLQDPATAESFIRKVSGLCTAIRDTPVPVVALISGSCVGAGLEVAASCDIRVATKDARFSMPEVVLKIPSVVQARLLCDLVGWGRARHLMLTGYPWTAQEAYEAGLVTKLFESRVHMMNWAIDYMHQLNGGTPVYRAQKKLMRDWEDQSVDAGIEAGVRCFADTFAQEKHVKAIRNSINKAMASRRQRTSGRSGKSQSEDNASMPMEQTANQVQDKY